MIQCILKSNHSSDTPIQQNNDSFTPNPTKKRGRKPKGGKIISSSQVNNSKTLNTIENIILHLNCNSSDLANQPYDSYNSSNFQKSFFYQQNNDSSNYNEIKTKTNNTISNSKLNQKLKELQFNLHQNHVYNTNSCCFWDTEPFTTTSFHIPKGFTSNSQYSVYGHFCSPQCATAYLFKENIDQSVKMERYQLLNHLYSSVLETNEPFKAAPSPYYMLSKFLGNLTIDEYRSINNSCTTIYFLDKPITKVLPEFHEDNNDYVLNIKSIPTS